MHVMGLCELILNLRKELWFRRTFTCRIHGEQTNDFDHGNSCISFRSKYIHNHEVFNMRIFICLGYSSSFWS